MFVTQKEIRRKIKHMSKEIKTVDIMLTYHRISGTLHKDNILNFVKFKITTLQLVFFNSLYW